MAAKKDYRAIKKFLNKFHNFSFKMPRKGKDFTPQQKSALTKQLNKLNSVTKSVAKDTAGFLPLSKSELKKLPENFDFIEKTNKGVFTKFSNPQKVKTKNKKEPIQVKTKIGVREERFFPFPSDLNTMNKIQKYVNNLIKKYAPNYVRWSVKGYRGGELFSPETFNNYAVEFGNALKDAKATKRFKEDTFFNGVFLGWLGKSARS